MKSKRGELKSRKCGPDCSEKQYSEIRQVTAQPKSAVIGSPRNPPPINAYARLHNVHRPWGRFPSSARVRSGGIKHKQIMNKS